MKRLIISVLIAVLAWQGYEQYKARRAIRQAPETSLDAPLPQAQPAPDQAAAPLPAQPSLQSDASLASPYKCDDRTYCSQMTSCAEATFFLQSCPGVKMDGNHDGVPCEKQWCNP